MNATKLRSLRLRANILLMLRRGVKTSAELSAECKCANSGIAFHLNVLLETNQIAKEVKYHKIHGRTRLSAFYTFIEDKENLIDRFASISNSKIEVETDVLKKWLGFTSIVPKGGKIYTDKTIEKTMRDKGITKWNPTSPKKTKVYIPGATLRDII